MLRLPQRVLVSIWFVRNHHRLPRLRHPRTFSEKIQVRKLRDRDQRFVRYSDKAQVKGFVATVLGERWCVPTLYCGKELPESPAWPVPFVIKSTHASGQIEFVSDEAGYRAARAAAPLWLTAPFGRELGEWHYAMIDPQLIVEPLLGTPGEPPPDYKFFVFGGEVKLIQVDLERFVEHRRGFYDTEWRQQAFGVQFKRPDHEVARPQHLEEMIEAAKSLAQGFDFVRVDLYDLPDGPRFGEMTFVPGSGFERFTPRAMDATVGALWR